VGTTAISFIIFFTTSLKQCNTFKVNEYKAARGLIESNLLTIKRLLSNQRKIIYELNKESNMLIKGRKESSRKSSRGNIQSESQTKSQITANNYKCLEKVENLTFDGD
jgi:hypothetical protein